MLLQTWWKNGDLIFFNKNGHLSILGMLNWSDSQRARWIRLSARTSPAAPHPSCHFWPGDRPRWPPHTHPRWWQCPRCLSTSFPKPRLHHWEEGRKERELVTCEVENAPRERANSFTHRSVYSPGPTPHLSSARLLAEQLIVLTGAPIAPWQAAKSLRKWALTSCNIRDIAETLLKNSASAIRHNQHLSCRAPVLRLGGKYASWLLSAVLVLPQAQVETLSCSARYVLTLSGPWN